MKKAFLLLLCISLLAATACAAAPQSGAAAQSVTDVILSTGTTNAFTQEAVPEKDLKLILQAGIQTASAQNKQPWYFVALTNHDMMEEIAADGPDFSSLKEGTVKALFGDSPVAILVYNASESVSVAEGFDCGLATQNMVIAASSLGYGTKVIGMPTLALNGENHDAWCERLGVDASMQCCAVILLGRIDTDAVSTATTRMRFEEKVSIIN